MRGPGGGGEPSEIVGKPQIDIGVEKNLTLTGCLAREWNARDFLRVLIKQKIRELALRFELARTQEERRSIASDMKIIAGEAGFELKKMGREPHDMYPAEGRAESKPDLIPGLDSVEAVFVALKGARLAAGLDLGLSLNLRHQNHPIETPAALRLQAARCGIHPKGEKAPAEEQEWRTIEG